eukprot:5671704-Alexandrium_andersonii.AAC.1
MTDTNAQPCHALNIAGASAETTTPSGLKRLPPKVSDETVRRNDTSALQEQCHFPSTRLGATCF